MEDLKAALPPALRKKTLIQPWREWKEIEAGRLRPERKAVEKIWLMKLSKKKKKKKKKFSVVRLLPCRGSYSPSCLLGHTASL